MSNENSLFSRFLAFQLIISTVQKSSRFPFWIECKVWHFTASVHNPEEKNWHTTLHVTFHSHFSHAGMTFLLKIVSTLFVLQLTTNCVLSAPWPYDDAPSDDEDQELDGSYPLGVQRDKTRIHADQQWDWFAILTWNADSVQLKHTKREKSCFNNTRLDFCQVVFSLEYIYLHTVVP